MCASQQALLHQTLALNSMPAAFSLAGTLALDLAAECGESRLSAAMAEDAFKQTRESSDQVWIGACAGPIRASKRKGTNLCAGLQCVCGGKRRGE